MKPVLVEKPTTHRTAKPKISVSSKGTIYVNSSAIKVMGINKETNFFIFQDQENKKIWYIKLDQKGYCKLKIKGKNSAAQSTIGVGLSKKIHDVFGHDSKKSLGFLMLDVKEYEGERYYPLQVIKESIQFPLPDSKKAYEFSKKNT